MKILDWYVNVIATNKAADLGPCQASTKKFFPKNYP